MNQRLLIGLEKVSSQLLNWGGITVSFIENAIENNNYDTPYWHHRVEKIYKSLKEIGIDIKDENDNFLPFAYVLKLISEKWNSISDDTKKLFSE